MTTNCAQLAGALGISANRLPRLRRLVLCAPSVWSTDGHYLSTHHADTVPARLAGQHGAKPNWPVAVLLDGMYPIALDSGVESVSITSSGRIWGLCRSMWLSSTSCQWLRDGAGSGRINCFLLSCKSTVLLWAVGVWDTWGMMVMCFICEHQWVPDASGETPAEVTEQDFAGLMVKKCPRCKEAIQKNGGCDHMTCRCHYEFWWSTLQPYAHR